MRASIDPVLASYSVFFSQFITFYHIYQSYKGIESAHTGCGKWFNTFMIYKRDR